MSRPADVAVAAIITRRARITHDPQAGGGGAPSYPSTALQFDGTYWTVDDANTVQPDAYYVIIGPDLFIDDAASSGEPIAVIGGNIFVGT